MTEFFDTRDVVFPHETKFGYKGSNLLYLDFRPVPEPVRDPEDGYSFVNVSVAEICSTNKFTANALYETPDCSRNRDGEKNLEWHGQPYLSILSLLGYLMNRQKGRYALHRPFVYHRE